MQLPGLWMHTLLSNHVHVTCYQLCVQCISVQCISSLAGVPLHTKLEILCMSKDEVLRD